MPHHRVWIESFVHSLNDLHSPLDSKLAARGRGSSGVGMNPNMRHVRSWIERVHHRGRALTRVCKAAPHSDKSGRLREKMAILYAGYKIVAQSEDLTL